MRIAIVYDCLYPWTTGGAERLFRGYAEEWVAEGHDVTYLTRRQWEESDPARVPGVRVEAIADRVELYDTSGTRLLLPAIIFAWAVLRALARRRRDFDVVFVSSIPNINVLAARAALVGARPRLIVDWLEIWRPQQWREYSGALVGRVVTLVQAVAARLSPRAVCYSRLHAQRLRAVGFRGTLFVSPGLLPAEEVARTPRFEPPERPQLLFVGRHIADKRVELVPAAVADLRRSGIEVSAVITGDGPTREAVIGRARALGVEDACTFPGFVTQEELDELMTSSTCLVNPSVREGYGLVVVEAAATGTPSVVVSAPDNAAAELVEDGVNGFVAASPAAEPIADAIRGVLEGGGRLRRSTRQWFDASARHGTVRATARELLLALLGSAPRL